MKDIIKTFPFVLFIVTDSNSYKIEFYFINYYLNHPNRWFCTLNKTKLKYSINGIVVNVSQPEFFDRLLQWLIFNG